MDHSLNKKLKTFNFLSNLITIILKFDFQYKSTITHDNKGQGAQVKLKEVLDIFFLLIFCHHYVPIVKEL